MAALSTLSRCTDPLIDGTKLIVDTMDAVFSMITQPLIFNNSEQFSALILHCIADIFRLIRKLESTSTTAPECKL